MVDEIYEYAILLQTLRAKEKAMSTGDALDRNVDKQGEVIEWFKSTLSSMEQRFDKYLRLAH